MPHIADIEETALSDALYGFLAEVDSADGLFALLVILRVYRPPQVDESRTIAF